MAGCRALKKDEIAKISEHLSVRDKCLFILGLRTGFRVSELLSLTIKDVWENGKPRDHVRVWKRNMKGERETRRVPLHPEAKAAIMALHCQRSFRGEIAHLPLFLSRNGNGKPLSRFGAHKALKDAYERASLTGALATHSMRKTFAKRVYEVTRHDLVKLQLALGHRDIDTTVKYLRASQDEVDEAILGS